MNQIQMFPACEIGYHRICAGITMSGSDRRSHDSVCGCGCHDIDWKQVSDELMASK